METLGSQFLFHLLENSSTYFETKTILFTRSTQTRRYLLVSYSQLIILFGFPWTEKKKLASFLLAAKHHVKSLPRLVVVIQRDSRVFISGLVGPGTEALVK